MKLSTMCIYRISLPTVTAKFVLAIAMLSGASVAQAAKTDAGICQGLDRAARGLCRAALQSDCTPEGRYRGSTRCSKLASNYRRITGDKPVWLISDNSEYPKDKSE